MSRLVVTGGSGFIGTNVVQYYLDKGWNVINISRSAPKIDQHWKYWIQASVTEKTRLSEIIQDFAPDYIIHLAGRTDLKGKCLRDYRANVDGVSNILEIASLCKDLKKIIFTSSSLASNPSTAYGESKAKGEQLVFQRPPQCDWSIIRPTAIWGPWFHSSYYTFFNTIQRGRYFHINHVNSTKTFGYIGNVVYQIDCILNTDTKANNEKIFYLGDYEPYDIQAWADEIAADYGKKLFVLPFWVAKIVAFVGNILESFGVSVPLTTNRLRNMMTDNIICLDKIKLIAPILPYTRRVGTQNVEKWLKNNHVELR